MFENPLLPHAQLRALHALMLRCRTLERRRKAASPVAREALLAATAIHLQAGDLICAEPGDPIPAHLAPPPKSGKLAGTFGLPSRLSGKQPSRLTYAAAAARGMQATTSAPQTALVLAFARAGAAEPGWEAALTWAQQAGLPLLVACADATGGKSATSRRNGDAVLDWSSVGRLSRRTKLPVISVDGEDAVAVYRVMQECVLRTRTVGGPAVIWAVMHSAGDRRAQRPLARLRHYMATRQIALR